MNSQEEIAEEYEPTELDFFFLDLFSKAIFGDIEPPTSDIKKAAATNNR